VADNFRLLVGRFQRDETKNSPDAGTGEAVVRSASILASRVARQGCPSLPVLKGTSAEVFARLRLSVQTGRRL